jgi:chromosome segregation ATPase
MNPDNSHDPPRKDWLPASPTPGKWDAYTGNGMPRPDQSPWSDYAASNVVFENVRTAIAAWGASLDAEVHRIEKLSVEAQELEQHVSALKVEERELSAANLEAAHRLASARVEVMVAHKEAAEITKNAKAKAHQIIEDAKAAGAKMQADAANAIAANKEKELDPNLQRLQDGPN